MLLNSTLKSLILFIKIQIVQFKGDEHDVQIALLENLRATWIFDTFSISFFFISSILK